MNKQEILNEIDTLKQKISQLEEKVTEEENSNYGRWKPAKNEVYYMICLNGKTNASCYNDDELNQSILKFYNCFKNKEEAEQEAEKILVRRMLENIARRLNGDTRVDWLDACQPKYYLVYNFLYFNSGQEVRHTYTRKTQSTVYCLDPNFINIAIKEIGKERLIKYLKGE